MEFLFLNTTFRLATMQKYLVKLQRRHRDMVKNGQKLKKCGFFLIKNLILEMAPIGMIQETRKKTEISDVVAAIVKKRYFFDVFSENHKNS